MTRTTSLLVLLFFGLSAWSQGTSQISASTSETHGNSRWSFEGLAQAHSVAGQASPWIGVSAQYRLLDPVKLGVRGFLPLSTTVDNATYAVQGFTRVRIIRGDFTDMFIEPSVAVDLYNWDPFTSYGLSVGVINHVSPGLSVGVMGGLEFARMVLDSAGLEKRTSFVMYPKIALLADFNL